MLFELETTILVDPAVVPEEMDVAFPGLGVAEPLPRDTALPWFPLALRMV
jgi:hypothetical protein